MCAVGRRSSGAGDLQIRAMLMLGLGGPQNCEGWWLWPAVADVDHLLEVVMVICGLLLQHLGGKCIATCPAQRQTGGSLLCFVVT